MDLSKYHGEERDTHIAALYEEEKQVKKALEKLSETELKYLFNKIRDYLLTEESKFILGNIYGFITCLLIQNKIDFIDSSVLKSLVKQKEPELLDEFFPILSKYDPDENDYSETE